MHHQSKVAGEKAPEERMPALSPIDLALVKTSAVIAVIYLVWALVQPAPPPQKLRPGAAVMNPGPIRDESCRFIGSQISRGCYPYLKEQDDAPDAPATAKRPGLE